MPSELQSERRGSCLILTLSDLATRNALSPALVAEASAALARAADDAAVRCVVLRGDGGSFCAGGNLHGLAERRQRGRDAQAAMLDALHGLVLAMRALPKPMLAAVEGVAAGAGFSLALACDLIVAADDATFVLSYGRIGLTPDAGATAQLLRCLPRTLVQQWVWLCEPVPAQRLQALGIVNTVTARGQALDAALALAGRLDAFAPNALASAKDLLTRGAGRGLAEQLDAEREHFLDNLLHANGGEGLQAFFDKRPPRFT